MMMTMQQPGAILSLADPASPSASFLGGYRGGGGGGVVVDDDDVDSVLTGAGRKRTVSGNDAASSMAAAAAANVDRPADTLLLSSEASPAAVQETTREVPIAERQVLTPVRHQKKNILSLMFRKQRVSETEMFPHKRAKSRFLL